MENISDSFLIECKMYFHAGHFPAMLDYNDLNSSLIAIAKNYISKHGFKSFSGYFQEYQYCVNLYTAHLFIEFNAPEVLQNEALEIIKRYSCSALNEEVAEQERNWLIVNEY